MRPVLLAMLAALLSACKAPDPAPQRFEELLGWMFSHAGDDDDDAMQEGVSSAESWMDQHFDESLEGYVVDPLTVDELDAVDAGDRDRSGLHGVAVGYPYVATAEDVAFTQVERRQNSMADTGDEEDVSLVDGDPDCYADGSCDRVTYDVDQVTDLGFGIQLETWMRYQYRRMPTDQGLALFVRAWTTQTPQINTDLFSVLQTYQMWMLLPEDGTWRSLQGEWVDARVGDSGLDVDFVMKMWIKGLIDAEASLDHSSSD